MMKIVDHFQSLGLLINGGYWDFPKGYFDSEALGIKVAWLKDRAENDRWTKFRKRPWGSTLPAIGSLWVFS